MEHNEGTSPAQGQRRPPCLKGSGSVGHIAIERQMPCTTGIVHGAIVAQQPSSTRTPPRTHHAPGRLFHSLVYTYASRLRSKSSTALMSLALTLYVNIYTPRLHHDIAPVTHARANVYARPCHRVRGVHMSLVLLLKLASAFSWRTGFHPCEAGNQGSSPCAARRWYLSPRQPEEQPAPPPSQLPSNHLIIYYLNSSIQLFIPGSALLAP